MEIHVEEKKILIGINIWRIRLGRLLIFDKINNIWIIRIIRIGNIRRRIRKRLILI